MESRRLHSLGLAIFVIICTFVRSEVAPRGVSRAKGSFYKPGVDFTCLDGSQTIPFDQINDDYCDCADGSDEPGTSACPNGQFYCINKGYKPEIIPSSRVSDGICDCCDGSDEYEGKVNCEDTCLELGKVMREEREAMTKLVEEGHRIRAGYAAQGQQAKAEKQELLVSLGPKRDELQKKKEELQLKKEELEKPEKTAKEAHESWWKEQVSVKEAEKEKQKAIEAFTELDKDQDGLVTTEEMQQRSEFDKDQDGTVSAEEVRDSYLAGSDSVDQTTFISSVWPNIKDVFVPPPAPEVNPVEIPPTDSERSSENVERDLGDDDRDDDDDFEEDDFDDQNEGTDDVKTPEDDSNGEMPPYPEETQKLIDAANAARDEFNQAEREYNDADKEIKDIEKFLALDLGPDDVFYPLRDQCYEYTDREYTYKFCPFDKASQRPKQGSAETSLGTFSKWESKGDDKYAVMKFERGLHCWNGPDRSADVKFKCGTENKLTTVSEPNRCEYAFEFVTPSACHQLLSADSDSNQSHLHTEL